jgi:hypothetical protein
MVDTPRTRTDLLTILADNITGDISPQDIRDMLVSIFGVWSAIYVAEGSTPQSGITTTPVKLTGFTTNIAGSGGMTPDHTDDSIEIELDGDYLVISAIAFSGSINQGFEIHVAVDGVETPFGTHRKLGPSGDEGSAIILAPLTGLVAAEKITLQANTTPSGTGSITSIDMVLFAIKIS